MYLCSVKNDDRLNCTLPLEEKTRKAWLRDDTHIFLKINNSIDEWIVGMINHYEYVEELVEYLDFFILGNIIYLKFMKYVNPLNVQKMS